MKQKNIDLKERKGGIVSGCLASPETESFFSEAGVGEGFGA